MVTNCWCLPSNEHLIMELCQNPASPCNAQENIYSDISIAMLNVALVTSWTPDPSKTLSRPFLQLSQHQLQWKYLSVNSSRCVPGPNVPVSHSSVQWYTQYVPLPSAWSRQNVPLPSAWSRQNVPVPINLQWMDLIHQLFQCLALVVSVPDHFYSSTASTSSGCVTHPYFSVQLQWPVFHLSFSYSNTTSGQILNFSIILLTCSPAQCQCSVSSSQ